MEELLMEKENSIMVASGGEESGEESGEVSHVLFPSIFVLLIFAPWEKISYFAPFQTDMISQYKIPYSLFISLPPIPPPHPTPSSSAFKGKSFRDYFLIFNKDSFESMKFYVFMRFWPICSKLGLTLSNKFGNKFSVDVEYFHQ